MSMVNWEVLKTTLLVLICIKLLLGGKPPEESFKGLRGQLVAYALAGLLAAAWPWRSPEQMTVAHLPGK